MDCGFWVGVGDGDGDPGAVPSDFVCVWKMCWGDEMV